MNSTNASENVGAEKLAPWPGSHRMPRWNLKELTEPGFFRWTDWRALVGPGILMAGSAIGGGEWLTGPTVTARFGGGLLWLATLSIVGQVIYNLELCRYTLYSGEPIFTGKFRLLPDPRFWLLVYLLLDWGSFLPYLPTSAATPLAALILGHIPKVGDPLATINLLGFKITENHFTQGLGYLIFLAGMIPLVFGGKIYNMLRTLMTFKVFGVLGYLLIFALLFSKPATWIEIFSGFVKFGNVPITAPEDTNGNGQLDPGEDYDGDGRLDPVEPRVNMSQVKNPKDPDKWDRSKWDPGDYEDLDKDGTYDGDKVDNVFVAMWEGRPLPVPNLAALSVLCVMVAIAGQGGLSNTPLSNYVRDQGWGMGHHVGAIPSVVGGHHLELSHMGAVFSINETSLARWKKWYRFLLRDQLMVWFPACFIGLALPSMLSVQFLKRGTEKDTWSAAGATADGVGEHVGQLWGEMWGNFFWAATLLCGFFVLAPTVATTADGVIRRWVDVLWTGSEKMRKYDDRHIRFVYFSVLCGYVCMTILMMQFVPVKSLLPIASIIYNYALSFSCAHTLWVNCSLLPKEIRPSLFMRAGMVLTSLYFFMVALLTTYTFFFPA